MQLLITFVTQQAGPLFAVTKGYICFETVPHTYRMLNFVTKIYIIYTRELSYQKMELNSYWNLFYQ